MKGTSHALSGACAGLAAGIVLHRGLPATAALGGYTAGMALLPDLDSCGSSAARCLGFITGTVAHAVRAVSGGHRHATHSLLGVAVFTGLAWLACWFRHDWPGRIGLALLLTIAVSAGLESLRVTDGHLADVIALGVAGLVAWRGYGLALIPLAAGIGTATHIAGDMLTDSGCNLAWPLSRRKFHLLPEPLAFTTGSRPERWIVDPALACMLAGLAVLGLTR